MSAGKKIPKVALPALSRQKHPSKHGAYISTPHGLQVRARTISRIVGEIYEAVPHLRGSDSILVEMLSEMRVIRTALLAHITKVGVAHEADGDVIGRRIA